MALRRDGAQQDDDIWVSGQIGHSLRVRTFRTIVRANHGYIDSRPPGMLLNALGTETWRVAEGVRLIASLVTHGCGALVFFTVMLLMRSTTRSSNC